MKFIISKEVTTESLDNEDQPPSNEVKVGNVYAAVVGHRAALGFVYVIFAITAHKPDGYDPDTACCFVVDKDGDVRDMAMFYSYFFHNRTPIAFVEGIEKLTFNMHKYEEM
jgi:hypothetical protein